MKIANCCQNNIMTKLNDDQRVQAPLFFGIKFQKKHPILIESKIRTVKVILRLRDDLV